MKNNPSFAKQFPLQSTNASLMSKLNSDIECYGSCLEFSVTVTMILHFTLKQLDRKCINNFSFPPPGDSKFLYSLGSNQKKKTQKTKSNCRQKSSFEIGLAIEIFLEEI